MNKVLILKSVTPSFKSVTDCPITLYNQANTFCNSPCHSLTPLLFKSQVQWGAVTEFKVVIPQHSSGKFFNRLVLTVRWHKYIRVKFYLCFLKGLVYQNQCLFDSFSLLLFVLTVYKNTLAVVYSNSLSECLNQYDNYLVFASWLSSSLTGAGMAGNFYKFDIKGWPA